jgi:hypothetical protein
MIVNIIRRINMAKETLASLRKDIDNLKHLIELQKDNFIKAVKDYPAGCDEGKSKFLKHAGLVNTPEPVILEVVLRLYPTVQDMEDYSDQDGFNRVFNDESYTYDILEGAIGEWDMMSVEVI